MSFLADVDVKTALAACGLVVVAAVSNATSTTPTSTTAQSVNQPAVERNVPAPEKSGLNPPRPAPEGDRAARSAPRPKPPSTSVLMPHQVQGRQQQFTPNVEQMRNARTIIRVSQEMGLPPRAAVIAVATSLQESKLYNLGHLGARNDHDSQGLFQQRPSTGWGTVEQITNPAYSSKAFYKALMRVDRWEHLPLTVAAQKVQVSAFPFAYAKWEVMASNIVLATYGVGPYADVNAQAVAQERAEAAKAQAAADAAKKKAEEAKKKAEEAKKKALEDAKKKAEDAKRKAKK